MMKNRISERSAGITSPEAHRTHAAARRFPGTNLRPVSGVVAGAVLLVLIAGCSNVRKVSRKGDVSIIERKMYDEKAKVTLLNGRTVSAEWFQIDSDSASWVDPVFGEQRRIVTDSVVRIETRDISAGIEAGMGRGALIGGGIGLLLGLIQVATMDSHSRSNSVSQFDILAFTRSQRS